MVDVTTLMSADGAEAVESKQDALIRQTDTFGASTPSIYTRSHTFV